MSNSNKYKAKMLSKREQNEAVRQERDRLRDLLERVHGVLHDSLNATPLDSPEGTCSGFDYERQYLQRTAEKLIAHRSELERDNHDLHVALSYAICEKCKEHYAVRAGCKDQHHVEVLELLGRA